MAIKEVFIYLCVPDVNPALDFYGKAFGATEKFRLAEPSGRVGHIELSLGDQILMLSEPFPEIGIKAYKPEERHPFAIHLHVDNADEVVASAIAAGATEVFPLSDQFYGERSGRVCDPFGYEWILGHTIEDVSPEEMQRRYTAMMESGEGF